VIFFKKNKINIPRAPPSTRRKDIMHECHFSVIRANKNICIIVIVFYIILASFIDLTVNFQANYEGTWNFLFFHLFDVSFWQNSCLCYLSTWFICQRDTVCCMSARNVWISERINGIYVFPF
jgi:hypothetical protein